MNTQKTKSIQRLENLMQDVDPSSFRYHVLASARDFKNSWIELGRGLYSVYKDKLFKDWGYLTFEAYCAKEVGIRQATAVKLLKSYSFLEREEPAFLKSASAEDRRPSELPSLEAVNSLRLAKSSERISEGDYESLREDILDRASEDQEVKKKIRYLLKKNPPKLSPEEKETRKSALIRRLLTAFRGARQELVDASMPEKVVQELERFIDHLSEYER